MEKSLWSLRTSSFSNCIVYDLTIFETTPPLHWDWFCTRDAPPTPFSSPPVGKASSAAYDAARAQQSDPRRHRTSTSHKYLFSAFPACFIYLLIVLLALYVWVGIADTRTQRVSLENKKKKGLLLFCFFCCFFFKWRNIFSSAFTFHESYLHPLPGESVTTGPFLTKRR